MSSKTIKKIINKRHTVSRLKPAHGLRHAGENGPWQRHSGLPRTVDPQVGWALAWRPGPAEEAPYDARERGAHRALAARSPRPTAARWGWPATRCCRRAPVGSQGGAGAGEVEAGLTLAMPRRAGAVRWRRGGGRHRGREGSGERRGQRGVGRQRWCRATAAGGGTRVTDKRGRVSTGPSGQ
jgi:hypothetical protein